MNTRTEQRVDDWSTRPVDGYQGLRDLADEQFSGAVRARGTWLFMLNGRIVGVFEGAIEDFESASATAHEAPDPSLPLLFTMLEKGGEQQAKYYTEDTPVADADGTLSSGSFTGFIELSENVLSGDYYTVYYGGKSMSCAFVGNSEELITGDEAFERANDEVGIYEVRNVDIEVTDVPDPSGGAADADGTGAASDAGGPSGTSAGADAAANEPAGREATNGGDVEAGTEPDAGAGEPTRSEPSGGAGADPQADANAARSGASEDPEPGSARNPDAREPAGGERGAGGHEANADPNAAGRGDPAAPGRGEPDEASAPDREPATDDGAGPADSDPTHPTERESFDVPGAEPEDVDAPDPDELAERAESTDAAEAATGRTVTDASSAGPDDEPTGATPAVDAAEAAVDATETEPARSDPASAEGAAGPDPNDAARESYDADLGTAEPAESDDDGVDPTYESEEEWQEARTIPSLDPDRSSTGDEESPARSETRQSRAGSRGRSAEQGGARPAGRDSGGSARRSTDRERSSGSEASRSNASRSDTAGAGTAGSDETLKQEVLEREDKIDQLQQRVSNLQGERDDLRVERDEYRDEAESLRGEVEDLEAEIERLESEVNRLERELEEARRAAGGAPNAGRQIGAAEALRGTNLFVRYASKGDATLEDAHAGDADAETVNANLRLEHHTQFDSEEAAVDGKAFDEFLTDTLEFNFVDWIVGGLLYEIRDTGHATSLEGLYDAIPQIDRAELKGDVSLVYTENGDEVREQKQFDVVLRDRMGNPLVVADLNDARDPVTQDGMATLESDASRLKGSNEHLSAAFVVTSSFFDPGALETAAEATSGSFLSRDSKKSFVKISRKQGYHLCLVESRGRDFHLNVPEL
ncbi:transcriptional regulator [Halostella sp. JP-L12]|uniref:DUF7527 domain-containing protein n=1 Tax=Halostella TaxID=1843185 RepID=UPI000EF81EE1|nr:MULTISPECIES: transcriptional regulator [Halostella]NHN48887.1 transcriptional regulator [Halostella sp. JP-L12]